MGFFNKIFGTNETAVMTAAELLAADIVKTLSMHLRGEMEPALSGYLKIAEEYPDDNLAPFFISSITAGNGNVAEAAESLRSLSRRMSLQGEVISKAITLNLVALMDNDSVLTLPAVAEIIVSFGDLLNKERFVQENAVCFEIAAGLVPANAHVLHKLGDTLHDLGAYDYAESVLLEALNCAPNHWGALYTYAVLLQDLGRFADAITYYERAVKLDPYHVKCLNNYGAALMNTDKLEEALAQCLVAAELDPGFPLVKINLGNIYLQQQKYEAARTCFEEAILLDKSLALAYLGLASVEQITGGDSERIRELCLKVIELNPSIPKEALEHLKIAVY